MKIKEIFYTLQGEGQNWGMPSVFVRLGECNLRCTFCDTDFLTGLVEMSVKEVASEIIKVAKGCRSIVITGGEPLLQQDMLIQLIDELETRIHGWYCAIETNGTIDICLGLRHRLDWVCVSPKVKPEAIKLRNASEVKVVYTEQYSKWLEGFYDIIQADHYFLSPEAESNNPYTKRINDMPEPYPYGTNFEKAIEYVKENPQWRLNLQTHKILNIR